MYGVSVTYASAIVAGVLTAAALAAWPWARSRRRCPDNPGELGRRWQRRGYSLCNRCGLRVGYGAPRARDPRGRRRVHRGIGCDDTGRLRLEHFSRWLIGQPVTTVRKPAQSVPLADGIERLRYGFHQGLLRASLDAA